MKVVRSKYRLEENFESLNDLRVILSNEMCTPKVGIPFGISIDIDNKIYSYIK